MPFGPTDRFDVLIAAMERVVETLCEQLVADGAAARRLLCVVSFEERPPAVVRVPLSRPSRHPKHLRSLLFVRLERVDLSAGAVGLRLTATETARWRPAQGDLFGAADRPDEEAIGELVDRLMTRLGYRAVVRAEPVEDHQPEKAFQYMHETSKHQNVKTSKSEGTKGPATAGRLRDEGTKGWSRTASQRQGSRRAKPVLHSAIRNPQSEIEGSEFRVPSSMFVQDRFRDVDAAATGERPLRLFARPLLIRVMAVAPEGPPTWLRVRDEEFVVAGAAGPERLETGWWRGGDVRRDYFRVLTECGRAFWVFRDLNTKQWYLHGSFE
jgi:protein ImuB